MLKGRATKLFLEAIKSPVTKQVYQRRLASFLQFVRMDVDSSVEKAKQNPHWAEEQVLKYLLREKRELPEKKSKPALLRLRAQLLPEEASTPSERRMIKEARREIEKGHYVTLTKLRKELGV